MADTFGITSSLANSVNGTSNPAKKKGDEVGKTEFLNLLVTQLKNQDPLNPMENQEFAVQLAQFSSLEQLISINDKVGGSGESGDSGSLSSYLGREVILNSDKTTVAGGTGTDISVKLDQDITKLQVQLLDQDGNVVEEKEIDQDIPTGRHTIKLQELTANDGEYQVRLIATRTIGGTFNPLAQSSGIIDGFVPGPDQKLLMGGKDVALADIVEVRIPPSA